LESGLSHLSNRYGFPADDIVSVELLIANGTLIIVTQGTNPGLFYALKAGSTNYGIVTRLTRATCPVSKVWGGTLVFTNEQRDSVLRAIAQYQLSDQKDKNSAILPYLGVSNDTIYISFTYLENTERPSAYNRFTIS
jgi:FAD/FMN-containing dehydrogenase